MGRLRGAAGSTRARGRRGRNRRRRVADERAGADRDRLGVRQQGEHGAVRRAGAGRGEDPGQVRSTPRAASSGRPLRIDTCDTNNNNAAKAKSCAASLLGKGANIIFTTCDVDFATPVVQESMKARQADDRPLHRHRPDGAEAVRHGGQARVQLRQRRPGRGLRDGGVRLAEGLADARTWRRTRSSSTSRTSSRRSRSASRSSAARSPAVRATRPARTTSTRRSAASTPARPT